MIFLGLILVLIAAGAGVLVLTEESNRYILFGYTIELTMVEMFLAGAAAGVVLLLGLWLLTRGSRRIARQRRKLRHARTAASSRVAELEDEKRDLERRLEQEHAAGQTTTGQTATGDRLVSRGRDGQ